MSKQMLTEDPVPTSGPNKSAMDVSDENVRDHINSHLTTVTYGDFITPYVALNRVKAVLQNYHIFIPGRTFLEGGSGSAIWPVNQFGEQFGIDTDGKVSVTPESDYSIYFEYRMDDNGMFMIFCEILDKEELDEVLKDLEEELNGEADESEDSNDE